MMAHDEGHLSEQQLAANLSHQWKALTRVRSEEQLQVLLADMKKVVWRHHAKRYLRRLLPLLLLAGIFCALLYNEVVVELIFIYTRLIFVNFIFPVVNLPKWARVTCLISNPVFNSELRTATPEDCHRCLGASRPLEAAAANFTAADFHKDFLEAETPVIVRGASAGWVLENMTVEHLHEFYVHEEGLKGTLACSMTTDQQMERNNNKLLLRKIIDRKPASWFALWEHCSMSQIKAFRPLFRRPPFLPPSISIGGEEMHSWLVLGRNTAPAPPAPIPFKGALFFLGQVKGQLVVKLEPNPACSACKTMDFTLSAGELLLVSDAYDLSVMPTGFGFSLSFGFAGDA